MKTLKTFGLMLIITLLSFSFAFSESAKLDASKIDTSLEYEVFEVVDGDTIKIKIADVVEVVRLLQIDTPESVHPNKNKNVEMGKTASEFTKKFLKDKSVKLSFDKERRDKYNRLLCYIYITNEKGKTVCLNQSLVENALAKTVKYEPNVLKYEDYKKIEKPLREKKVGIWKNIEANYPGNRPTAEHQKEVAKETQKSNLQPAPTTATQGLIKGNKNSKIYHCPGQRDYDKIKEKNIVYFETEEQAIAAGYRKAKR